MLGRKHSFQRNFYNPERYQANQGQQQQQRSKIGAAYAEYEMLPSWEARLSTNYTNKGWSDNYNQPNKHSLYKKAASAYSLQKCENEGDAYNDGSNSGRFGGGFAYDTDVKYHYGRIDVVPGNDKWRNSSNYSKSTGSTNSSDASYSVPKPFPRRDSLRGTKSVFQPRPPYSIDTPNENLQYGNNPVKNVNVPNKTELVSSSYNRANSAPPASPRHTCNANRFTWWFGGSSAFSPTPKSILANKTDRYVFVLTEKFNHIKRSALELIYIVYSILSRKIFYILLVINCGLHIKNT